MVLADRGRANPACPPSLPNALSSNPDRAPSDRERLRNDPRYASLRGFRPERKPGMIRRFPPPTVAPSDRFGFRPLGESDLALLHRWLSAPHVLEWWDQPGPTPEEV